MKAVVVKLTMDLIRILLIAAVFTGGAGIAAGASDTPVKAVNTEQGVGLKGYDPVAYFTAGQATPGVNAYTYRFHGVMYRFASANNLERFKGDPEKYLPQYGGYCAYAMAHNLIADIDPTRWAIVEGRLFLNNGRFAHTLWSFDKPWHIAAADRNWPTYPKRAEEP
jgi:YHS domain-containing protein